ncbi:flavin monoamine oxidase family protein [Shewanella surugensis]|uniref:FAD-dependent oxidoreductase n=1 Tax=Shewanella surugensis TaxID=212020 RepID=A0ABT0LE27_9GAMM|nr:FAD-dependent oxidoreductase [Shewanella surugensis]MCL1125957.1 FAD-dependent oxidoreductase [Shewanella surugensis]
MNKQKVDIIIVGAGLAGLSAAKKLQEQARTFVVLEARDRVGGRLLTEQFSLPSKSLDAPTHYWIDSGGQWISPTQTSIRALADEMDVTTFTGAPDNGKVILIFKGEYYQLNLGEDKPTGCFSKVVTLFKQNFSYDYNEFQTLELELDKMANDFSDGQPWGSPNAKKWDSITAQAWIDANAHTEGAKFLLNLSCLLAFAATPSDLSLLHLLFYIHCAGGLTKLHNALAYRLNGGAQEVPKRIAAQLQDNVKYGNPVSKIINNAEGVKVILSNGDVYEADHVIVTVPPALQANITFSPPLPASRRQLQQRMPMGSSVKCHLVYETPFWREKGYSGLVYSDEHVLPFITDNSNPQQSSPGILGCFLEAETVRKMMDKPIEEIQTLITKTIEDIYQPFIGTIPKPVAVHVMRWSDEQWSGGAYAGMMPPGVWTGYQNTVRESVNRIHWAGTETATKWFAYMDGAVRSGYNAVDEIYGHEICSDDPLSN